MHDYVLIICMCWNERNDSRKTQRLVHFMSKYNWKVTVVTYPPSHSVYYSQIAESIFSPPPNKKNGKYCHGHSWEGNWHWLAGPSPWERISIQVRPSSFRYSFDGLTVWCSNLHERSSWWSNTEHRDSDKLISDKPTSWSRLFRNWCFLAWMFLKVFKAVPLHSVLAVFELKTFYVKQGRKGTVHPKMKICC